MALDLFLSPLISLAVNKSSELLIQEICQISGLEDNRKKLHRYLLAIQQKVEDAEVRGGDNRAEQEWMKELDAAAREAADVLDDFHYEALRRQAIHQQPSSPTKVMKSCFIGENQILFRCKMGSKLTKILEKIHKIVTEMNEFNFISRDPATPSFDRETQSLVMESEVIGRKGEREEIVNVLLDPQRERENFSVLPIVGMGGLGKTTLAQLVYNDERVQGHFQLKMWVCVSIEFDVVNILKSIIQLTPKGEDVSSFGKEALQKRLHEIIDKQRYLLVLDDVWNQERENFFQKWNDLKALLSFKASSGSMVLVTTRSKEVAEIMGTLSMHDLALLTDEDSWSLFAKRAFAAGVEETEELAAIGKTIVSKCGGLPLAVKAMGGLMGTKSDVHGWRAVAENEILDSLASSGKVLPLLKLSYDQLPSYMKQCFAFCAVFPQDYSIERDTLIQLWMANDFIPTNGTMDLEDKGRQIFNELYWRSFFQEIGEEERDYGSIIKCKMHDLMHDLATQVAGKKCSTWPEKIKNQGITQNQEVQHLFVSEYESSEILKHLPNIHTFFGDGNVRDLEQNDKYYNLMGSRSLRALKFQFIRKIPKELGYMRHLRYLDLSTLSHGDSTFLLPESLNKLYNLQTLILSNTSIRELPKGMRYMTNLRHLCLDGCFKLEWMPIGLGQLKCLRTLTMYVVDPDRGGSLGELKNLNDLSGRLSLSGLEKVRDRGDAEAANLAAKSNLSYLDLYWDISRETSGNDQAILEALTPPNNLEVLYIKGFWGSSFPKWMKESMNMQKLKKLRLDIWKNCVELPPLWQLPSLEYIFLNEMENLKFFVGGTCGSESVISFPRLEVLELWKLPNLEGWHDKNSELIIFPKLNALEIYRCPKLKTIPVHIPLLRKLEVEDSGEIKLRQISNLPMLCYLRIKVDSSSSTETDAFRPPKTLEEMRIEGFENVDPLREEEEGKQSCQVNSLRELTIVDSHCFFSFGRSKLALGFWKNYFAALQILWIGKCNNLVYWPEEEFGSLKCLKKLIIYGCASFTGSLAVSSSPIPIPQPRGELYSLPHLESLEIYFCPELVEVPGCSTSLKNLGIYSCPKLSREGVLLANLTELRKVEIWSCTNLRALPDNMGHLPSLEELQLWDCPGIDSFPEGLQQRLPSLLSLDISLCPALQRRLLLGGDYNHLVSSIPDVRVPEIEEETTESEIEEETTKCESILRRLLPKCTR